MIATMLLYINAAFEILDIFSFPFYLLLIAGQVAGGLGIANERKLGYWLAVTIAVLSLVPVVLVPGEVNIVSLIFQVALVVLLLHPQSRSYKHTWFR
jgi:hypothetical protein